MSAKILHALKDDNPDLQRQIGCMTGIFQLFDRQDVISGRSIYDGQQHTRLPPSVSSVHLHLSTRKVGAEESTVPTRTSLAKTQIQNHCKFIESSTGSSSCCSSSFPSIESNRNAQIGLHSYDQSMKDVHNLYTSSIDHKNALSTSWKDQSNFAVGNGSPSINFRDIVKASMYRESRDLSAGMGTNGVAENHVMKPSNSPRPSRAQRLVDASSAKGSNKKARVPLDMNESPMSLTKTTDLTSASNEVNCISLCPVPKGHPRFSYDGREKPQNSFDSRDDVKSTTKLKISTRSTTDGKDYSSRTAKFEIKPTSSLIDFSNHSNQRDNGNRQSLSIVAKLMGLEALPSLRNISGERQEVSNTLKTNNSSLGSSKVSGENRYLSRVKQDPVSAQGRNDEVAKGTISVLHVPSEIAPWTLPGRSHDFATEVQTSQLIFSEIGKRLNVLKSQHCEKDLTDTTDMMQATILDTDNVRHSNGPAHKLHPKHINAVPESGSDTSLPVLERGFPSVFDSPIVIMRAAKFINDYNIITPVICCDNLSFPVSNALIKDFQQISFASGSRQAKVSSPKCNNNESGADVRGDANKELNFKNEVKRQRLHNPSARPVMISSKSQQSRKDNNNNKTFSRNLGSLSPHLQRGEQRVVARTRQTTALMDSKKTKQHPSRKTESGQKGRKLTPDSVHCSVPVGDHTGDISSDKCLIYEADESSTCWNCDISSTSHFNTKVTNVYQSSDVNKAVKPPSTACNIKEKVEESLPDLTYQSGSIESSGGHDHTSPVSLLDQSLYKEDLPPSHALDNSCHLKDEEGQNTDVLNEESSETAFHFPNARRSLNFCSSKSYGNKLGNVTDFIQKLQQTTPSHEEAAKDHIVTLSEKTTPDNRYISEILLASGFQLDNLTSDSVTPIQTHSSGNMIDPDLFFVLEKTNTTRPHQDHPGVAVLPDHDKTDSEQLHRRLIFDTVNELLMSKFLVLDAEPWIPAPMSLKPRIGRHLLHEVCTEIDNLACQSSKNTKDWLYELSRKMEDWSNRKKDVSAVVLDIERMIFKDLVDEIVNGKRPVPNASKQNRRHVQPNQTKPKLSRQASLGRASH